MASEVVTLETAQSAIRCNVTSEKAPTPGVHFSLCQQGIKAVKMSVLLQQRIQVLL